MSFVHCQAWHALERHSPGLSKANMQPAISPEMVIGHAGAGTYPERGVTALHECRMSSRADPVNVREHNWWR